MSTNNSPAATLATQSRSLTDFQTAPFDQTQICESTFTSEEDKELKKGICHGLSVLWIKRYCGNPSEPAAQRISFLQENIPKAAKMQNYYHAAKGAAFSPAYKKKREPTSQESHSLEQVKALEAKRVANAKELQSDLDSQQKKITVIDDQYNLDFAKQRELFFKSKDPLVVAKRATLLEAEKRKKELQEQADTESETVGAGQLNWALSMFKMIANKTSRKFQLTTENSAAVINDIHTALGDGPALMSLSHGSMESSTNKSHAWSAYLDNGGLRVFDPIKGEFFADLQHAGALLDALKSAYDSTGQTLFTMRATKVDKL